MVATKVGEAYVEVKPRIAKDFGKQIREGIEKQLKPITNDLGRNIGDSLGDSVGENFSARFGDHARDALDTIEIDGSRGAAIGQTLGDRFGREFSDNARERIKGLGDGIEVDLRTSFTRVSEAASTTGRAVESNLTKHLAGALSGAKGLATGIGSLGASAVLTSGQLAVMAGSMGVAAQGALSLGVALAPAAGALAALPGLILTLGAAQATLKTIFSGLDDAFGSALTNNVIDFQEAADLLPPTVRAVAYELHGLRDQVTNLRGTVQEAFFGHLVGEVEGLNVVLPILRDSMSGVAEWFGIAAREVVRFATDVQTLSAIKSIFHDLRGSLSEIVPELDILLAGFRDLGVVGSGYLADLAPGIADLVNQLGWFMYHAAASGDALRWMENAGAVFKQLGAIIGDVGGIIAAVFRAFSASGDDALSVVGRLLDGLHAFLDSAQGQEALVSIFSALSQIGSALLPVVLALANSLGGLAPTIGQIAETIGPVLTTAVNALAPALATVGPALVTVFTELGNAVTILANSGALPNVAAALASILVAVAPILSPLATLISLLVQGLSYAITTWVAPALSQLVTWISEAVEWLTGAGLSEDTWLSRTLRFLYETAAPLLQQAGEIISKVFSDIVTWVQENEGRFSEWGTKIQSIVTRVGEIVGGVFEFISWAWDNFGGPLLDIIGNVFSGILGVVDGVLTALSGLIEFVLGVITGDWERAWEGVKTFFSGIWDAIVAIAETIWNNLITEVKAVLALFDDNWEEHWNQVAKFAEDIWNSIVRWIGDRVDDIGDLLDWFGSLPGKFSDWFGRVKDAVVARFNDVVSFLQSIPNRILSFFSNAGSWLYNAGREIVNGLWNGIVSLWNWVVGQWDSMVTGLINTVKSILGIASPSKVMHEMGAFLVQGLARGIGKTAKVATDAVAALAASTVEAWGSPELEVAAWSVPDVAKRSPGDMRPAGDGLITHGAAGRYGNVSVTLNAAPDIPTERQIVTALSYADALYATT